MLKPLHGNLDHPTNWSLMMEVPEAPKDLLGALFEPQVSWPNASHVRWSKNNLLWRVLIAPHCWQQSVNWGSLDLFQLCTCEACGCQVPAHLECVCAAV